MEIRSPHFRLLTDGPESSGREVARRFEQMRDLFATTFPGFRLNSGAPLLILAPKDEDTFKKLMPEYWKGRKLARPAGVFIHGQEKTYAIVQLDIVPRGGQQVIYHEYVHSLLHLNFRWLPLWLDEGLADFYGNTQFAASSITIGAPPLRVTILRERSPIPMDKFLAANQSSPYYREANQAGVFYAQSWALVHYLNFGEGMEGGKRLQLFIKLLAEGMNQDKAFRQAIGDPEDIGKRLYEYTNQLAFHAGRINTSQSIHEKEFAAHALSEAETDAELGDFHMRIKHLEQGRQFLAEALQKDPHSPLAHESLGFDAFSQGKDADAAREFSAAFEADPKRYLSLYFKTMLSPETSSDLPADRAAVRTALIQVHRLNPLYAPPMIRLALREFQEGSSEDALADAHQAELLQPASAGYHILVARILLAMGRSREAALIAKYTADRWHGPDHDEAVEVWNRIPADQRTEEAPGAQSILPGSQTAEGTIRTVACKEDSKEKEISLEKGHEVLKFQTKGGFPIGFSDTLWYGPDHFSLCHHLEKIRAIVTYKPSSSPGFDGDLLMIELREELPPLFPPKEPARPAQPNF